MKRVRTRYAPSPTGHLHIGNARTALFTYLFAKHHDGDFIIRIEDTDIARNVENGETSQFENLKWLGIDWAEGPDKGGAYGPYRQLERLDIYQKYANELLERGLAYKCYCTEEELAAERETQEAAGIASPRYSGRCMHLSDAERAELEANREYTIRMHVKDDAVYTFNDIVRGEITFTGKDIGDWVAIKKNGIPTYNFACAIDDHFMEISHVFRGEEHISNTPKQMQIYEAFGWDVPEFGHMAIIVNEQRKKLSKRDESIMQFISQYKEHGYLPAAMFNFIGLLGWSPTGEDEIFSHEEFIRIFDAERLSTAPAMFDKEKLKWVNNRYMKQLSDSDYQQLTIPFLEKAGVVDGKSDLFKAKLVSLFQDQLSYGEEIIELAKPFTETFVLNEEATTFLKENDVRATIEGLKTCLEQADQTDFTSDEMKAFVNEIKTATGNKGKMLFMPLRIATSGMMHGPDLNSVMALLPKTELLQRIDVTLEVL